MRALREDIDKLQSGRDLEDADITDGNTLMDEVEVDLHVLHVMVLHGIGDKVDRADIVAVDECGTREGVMELLEHVTEPGRLRHVVCYNAILDLSAGAALRTSIRGWRLGTRRRQRCTGVCRGSRTNPRWCIRSTHKSEMAEEGRSRGCHRGSEESIWQRLGGVPVGCACEGIL
jgi:hypothetical protein